MRVCVTLTLTLTLTRTRTPTLTLTQGKSVVSKEDADLKLLQLSLNQLMHKKVFTSP